MKVIISISEVLIGHCVIFGCRKTCNKGTKVRLLLVFFLCRWIEKKLPLCIQTSANKYKRLRLCHTCHNTAARA